MSGTIGKRTLDDAAGIAARLERLPFTRYQATIFGVIATAWFFDSVDLGALTFLLGPIKTEFHLSAPQAGLLSSLSFVGMFFGASLAGVAADMFGRKLLFQVSMLFWGLGSIACGLSGDLLSLCLARVLVGFGMGMEFPIAQAMASEMAPAAQRGRYIALLEGFWPLGFIAAGLIALTVLPHANWRLVFLIEAAPAIFVFAIRWIVPESPRWLAARGKLEKANQTLEMMEARVLSQNGGKPLPLPERHEDAPAGQDWAVSFIEIWRGQYARRTVMAWSLWFFALLGYYGLTTWLSALLQQSGFPVTKSNYFTVLISLAGIPGFLSAAWLIERAGRKPTCIATLLGSAAACYLYGTANTELQLLGFGAAMQFFLFGMWSVLYAYTPELYPTRMRATGAGFASAVGRLGSILGPFLIGLILQNVGRPGVFAMGAGAFVVASLFVFALGIETRGKRVEQIAQ